MEVISSIVGGLTAQVTSKLVDPRLVNGAMLQQIARESKLTADIVATLPRALIVGEGGAGKSTLLRQMLARAAAAGSVPGWVSLAALPTDGSLTIPVLIDYLVREAGSRLGVEEVNREFFESLAASGQLAIGFDALDECPTLPQRQRVRGLIVEVARQWSSCQIFVTSRPEALHDTPLPLAQPERQPKPDEFIALTPLSFTREDIAPFLRVAFDDGDALAQQLLARTGIEALMATPLTLTLVGLVARTPRGLPATRTPLFARCLDTVCETWEAAKGSQPPSDGLDPAQRLDVLRRLGWAAQEAGGDALDADQARATIAGTPDREIAARAERVLAGLARRNLLLRAETADDGSFEVRTLRFSHPQFREYLAGAHLAGQFALDSASGAAAIAPHWLDSRWLEVLRFAVATVEARPAPRDALLRAALAADDSYRDLLHRPEFVVAQLLARLPQADATIVAQVVGILEAATAEPALRDAAADALLRLGQHMPARAAIARFASGSGAALAFPLDDSVGGDERRQSLRWRLHAIEIHAAASGSADALARLKTLPSLGLEEDLACCITQVRLGDAAGAEVALRRLFDVASDEGRSLVARAMDEAGLGARFNEWLTACVEAPDTTVARARLARERGLIRNDGPVWPALFERATSALAQLPEDENIAPQTVADAVYAAFEVVPSAPTSRSGLALIEAGLRHRAMLWFVAPAVLKALPELAAEAVQRLKDYVIDAQQGSAGRRPDFSRLNVAVTALANHSDDALVVPALLELLRELDATDGRLSQVVDSLRARNQAGAAFDVLLSRLDLTDEAAASGGSMTRDGGVERRRALWQLADRTDYKRVHAVLDSRFRGGEPHDDARHLMQEWNASGIEFVARSWLESIGADKSDQRAQQFLHTLTTHEADTAFTDFARQALYGGVFDDDPEPPRTPWTLDDYEKAFDWALKTGFYVDERDNEEQADARELAGLLSSIASLSDPALALVRADRWIDREMSADGTAADRGWGLAEALDALSTRGLREARWCDLAADVARALPPEQRADLLTWLRANV